MGKTYKDKPDKWRRNNERNSSPQKSWKKQKPNRNNGVTLQSGDDGLDSEGSPRW